MPLTFSQQPVLAQQVQPLGLAWCVFGVAGLFLRSLGHFSHHLHFIGFSTVFFSVLALLAGFGLLAGKPWARKLALVLGVLCLFKLPFGTALGVYTLWVLASSTARYQWRQLHAHPARY